MQEILFNLSPVFGFFLFGILLRRIGFMNQEQAGYLLKFVTFITLPALILVTVSQTKLTEQTAYLPLISIMVDLSGMVLMLILFRLNKIERQTRGTMLISTMVTNNVYMFPFILAVYGQKGFADAALFDFGNALLTNTVTMAIAMYYGGKHSHLTIITKLLKTPLFWAVILAVVMNLASIDMPVVAEKFLTPIGQMTGPLILIVLGVFFAPKRNDLALVVPTIVVRMGFGFLVGFTLASLLGLSGTTFAVVALCSGAPIGFIVLSFSSIYHLNAQFAATAVSISVLLGMFIVPAVMYVLGVSLI